MTQEPNIFPYIERLLEGAEVVWKPLGEVATFRRGSFPQPYTKSEWYGGTIQCLLCKLLIWKITNSILFL